MLSWVRDGWPGPGGSPWALPSTGDRGPRCGIHLGTAQACQDCEHRWPVLTSCRGWVCIGCAPSRVRGQAMATALRVSSIRDTLVMEHDHSKGLAIRRAVISPPPERARTAMDYDHGLKAMNRLRTQARAVAESHGFLGAVMVFHPWRDRQTWRFTEPGPHFHVIGLATWLEPGGADGWLFKASPARLRLGGVYDRLAYDLTHVGVYPSKPVLTYWGVLSGRLAPTLALAVQDRIAALEGGRVHVCPQCSGTNTQAIIPTLDELEQWGIIRPLERHRREVSQHRFKCDDCGHVDGLEPVPKAPGPGARPVNPWHYKDPERQGFPRGDHWTDGDGE